MRSIRALLLALSIHFLIFGWIWWLQQPRAEPKRYQEPSRILLSFYPPSYSTPSVSKRSAEPLQTTPKVPSTQKHEKAEHVDEAPQTPPAEEPLTPTDQVQRLIDRHYGELFDELSPAEKNYIIANILTIHRIDRRVGNALLADKPRNTFQDGESNFVEMTLHPDGTVSDITIISATPNPALDELTMETVERSYTSYPRPSQPTLIRLHTRIFKSKQ